MSETENAAVRIVERIGELDAAAWDACANPDVAAYDPFVSHGFLKALEDAGTVNARSGWIPQHLVLESAGTGTQGDLLGCMPCYLKSHSRGEFIFDHHWADSYERAGGAYYPKLQCAVPFTPVPGRRLLVRPAAKAEAYERALATGAIELARRLELSSAHITFLPEAQWSRLGAMGLLQRTDKQFHWYNQGFGSFDDFLGTLASRKRKAMRKERAQVAKCGLNIKQLTGKDITQAHWDSFFAFYQETGSRHWGRPYLNRRFFSLLGEVMADRCLLIICERDGRPVAGALHIIGGDCLYGRYWGCLEYHPFLHFELCYYRAIDFAIEHALARVEAGAQGDHKLVRGYQPVPTFSVHWIADKNFRAAVADYLTRERRHMDLEREALCEFTPFKKSC